MNPIRQQFSVTFTYDVLFTELVFDKNNTLLKECLTRNADRRPVRVLFVVDEGVVDHHPNLLQSIQNYVDAYRSLLLSVQKPLVVPGGEQVKNDPHYVDQVQEAIFLGGICRHSFVVAIGGGAVLDMAGFAAATAHRGVRLIRVPTTVLAQNDSGVGVKNGVNAFASKNFLGAFAPPTAVINDSSFLRTLDDRDWRAGISEAIKVALIKNAPFFEFVEKNAALLAPPVRDDKVMQHLIYECAKMHVEHISAYGDPYESGSSRPLDFGHWAAHKLEGLTDYRLRHGEAVAIGIALDCVYSNLLGILDDDSLERILSAFEQLGFDLFADEMTNFLDAPTNPESLFRGLDEFREHLGGELTIMLLEEIGKSVEVHEVDLDLYRKSIHLLQQRAHKRSINTNGILHA